MRRTPQILPNIITTFALSCGLFVIFKMNMVDAGEVSLQMLMATAAIIIAAAFLDVLDGAVARMMKAESDFGGLLDSLSDAVSFGVAPPVLILKTLSVEPGNFLSFLVTTSAMMYTICGVMRLVRFNVTNMQIQGDPEKMLQAKSNFTGLPIPAAAFATCSANLFLMSEEFSQFFAISMAQRAFILSFFFVFIGYLMISQWKFPSLKTLHFKIGSFKVVLCTVLIAGLVLFGMLHHFPLVFFGLTWAYLIASFCLSLVRAVFGKRIQALEEFDHDSEGFSNKEV